MGRQNKEGSFCRRWSIHWLTGLVTTLLFFSVSKVSGLEDTILFRTLDHAGADAVMRGYTPSASPGGARVAVVDIGPTPELAEVAKLLDTIRAESPRALGLDLIVVNDLGGSTKDSTNEKVGTLLKALADFKDTNTPIVLPVLNQELARGVEKLGHIREAGAGLIRDEDGVVRRTSDTVCAKSHDGNVTLPSLAAAMVHSPTHGTGFGCRQDDNARPILFAPVHVPRDVNPSRDGNPSGVYLVPGDVLKDHLEILKGSYVLVGDAGSDTTSDRFMTPMGPFPGVVIHAESVWTFASDENFRLDGANRQHFLGGALDLLTGAAAGAVFAIFLTRYGEHTDIHSYKDALRSFVFGIAGFVGIAIVLCFIGGVWTWYAASLLQAGVVVGGITAVFGAMLETLADVGGYLIAPIHWLVNRVVQHLNPTLVASLVCLSAGAVRAEDCSYTLETKGNRADIDVQPPISGRDVLHPFDRVSIRNSGTSVTVVRVNGTPDETMSLAGRDARTVSLILPPCAPTGGLAGAFNSFWAAMNPREPTTSTGATLIYRDLQGNEPINESGPLRGLTNLVSAAGTVAGISGLAFTWAGGSPPYRVAFVDEASGTPLGRGQAESTDIWLPEWATPSAPFIVIVRDAEGAALWSHLRPLAPPMIADIGTAEAIQLFETVPAYRLEALRRLVARARSGETLAHRAVALIRLTGASP